VTFVVVWSLVAKLLGAPPDWPHDLLFAWPIVLGAGLGGVSRREAMAITVTEDDVVGGAWFGGGRRITRDTYCLRRLEHRWMRSGCDSDSNRAPGAASC